MRGVTRVVSTNQGTRGGRINQPAVVFTSPLPLSTTPILAATAPLPDRLQWGGVRVAVLASDGGGGAAGGHSGAPCGATTVVAVDGGGGDDGDDSDDSDCVW